MIKIETKSNYSKLEFKLKKGSIDVSPTKDTHLLVSKTTTIDCDMVKKTSDLADGLLIVKMKTER